MLLKGKSVVIIAMVFGIGVSVCAANKLPVSARALCAACCKAKLPPVVWEEAFQPSGDFKDTVSWGKLGLKQEVPNAMIKRKKAALAEGDFISEIGRAGLGVSAGAFFLSDDINRFFVHDWPITMLGCSMIGLTSFLVLQLGSMHGERSYNWLASRAGYKFSDRSSDDTIVYLSELTRFADKQFALPSGVNAQTPREKFPLLTYAERRRWDSVKCF